MSDEQKARYLSQIPKRKNRNAGSAGRKIRVETNMISINFTSSFKISATHYDVKFDPDKPKFLKKIAFEALRRKHFPKNFPAFDGRVNAYSPGDLPFGSEVSSDNIIIYYPIISNLFNI